MAIIGGLILGMIVVGGGVGLFLVQNDRWERVELHPWLAWIFGDSIREAWLPMLMAGWLVAVLLAAAVIVLGLFYIWRSRQYESLITRIERELVALRNLPFADPAPFEDLAEAPDREMAELLAATDRSIERLSVAPLSRPVVSGQLGPGPETGDAPGERTARSKGRA